MSKEHMEIVEAHVAQLSEYFDTVQIFCTKKEEDDTSSYFNGTGNWYSRYGSVKAWIIAEEKNMKVKNRRILGGDK